MVSTFTFLGAHILRISPGVPTPRPLWRRRTSCEEKQPGLLPFLGGERTHILSVCAVWAGSTAKDGKALQRVINGAQKTSKTLASHCPLSSRSRCLSGTKSRTTDLSHPAKCLFDLLPSGWRYRSIKCHATRLSASIPKACDLQTKPNTPGPTLKF